MKRPRLSYVDPLVLDEQELQRQEDSLNERNALKEKIEALESSMAQGNKREAGGIPPLDQTPNSWRYIA